MGKLINSATLAKLKSTYTQIGTITDSASTNSAFLSIAFTDDGYLYTHGKLYKLTSSTGSETSSLIASLTGLTLQMGVSGESAVQVSLPSLTTSSDILSITNPTTVGGNYVINHVATIGTAGSITPSVSSYVLAVPKINYDKYGHIISSATGISSVHLDYVARSASTANSTNYLLFGSGSTTEAVNYATAINVNPSTGALSATSFVQNGTSLANTYAPIAHASSATTYGVGTKTNYGHIKLSDDTNVTAYSDGLAATPKAVYDALTAAKTYSDGLFASNDAMVFKGTIGTSGTVTSLPTNGYSAGWTYKVITAGTYAGATCEVGDMIVAVNDGPASGTSVVNADWSVIQTNIDGAVTTTNTLTANSIILGSGSQSVKVLTNGSNGTVLKLVNGAPAWSADTTRAIKVNGYSFLDENTTTTLNICNDENITLTKDAYGNLTIKAVDTTYSAGTGLTLTNTAFSLNTASASTLGGIKANYAATGNNYAIAIDTDGNAYVRVPWTNTTYVAATKDTLGLLKVSNVLSSAVTLTSGNGATASRYYGLQIDSAGQAFVNIPWTDTHYTANMYIGASGVKSNEATTNGNTYIKLYEESTSRGSFKITGSGATTVASDASGNITINSTNTWRNIKAWKLSELGTTNDVIDEVATTTIGTNALAFSSTFAYNDTNNQIDLVWTEIASDGTITYRV